MVEKARGYGERTRAIIVDNDADDDRHYKYYRALCTRHSYSCIIIIK